MTLLTADLVDAYQSELQGCRLQFRSFGGRTRFSGPISTVKTFEDNLRIAEAVHEPGRGRVLVVDGAGSLGSALVGDALAGEAVANGWSGLVVNGAIRDRAALADLPIGVLALGTNPWRSIRHAGLRDVTVTFGGATFEPGHWLCADEDGLVICPRPLG